jgi:hypothetical protein
MSNIRSMTEFATTLKSGCINLRGSRLILAVQVSLGFPWDLSFFFLKMDTDRNTFYSSNNKSDTMHIKHKCSNTTIKEAFFGFFPMAPSHPLLKLSKIFLMHELCPK